MNVTSQSWFGWAVGLVIVLPIALIALTELQGWLLRRGNPMAGPVAMLRNFALPAGALWVLFTQVWELDGEATWVRILATVFGFLLLVLVLAALNVVLFQQAATGTWRERMPSIFVDIVRLVLVVVGLAVLFSWVWDANVAGLFAALGVTSIVLGFALQNAVGSIISGLLLLFEQPFRLGDWLDTGSEKGRVIEVNWRAVHIDTGNGIRIVPNATLAGASFTNLSQPAGNHVVTVPTTFGVADPPDVVQRMLDQLALDLPISGIEPRASTSMTGPKSYATSIAIRSPADADDVAATFLRWTWYASRRAGLHLDGATDGFDDSERALEALRQIAASLHLRDDELPAAAAGMHIERWGSGERLQREGDVPHALRFVMRGEIILDMRSPRGDLVMTGQLPPGQILGLVGLTRQRILAGAVARTEAEVLAAPIEHVEELMRHNALFARDLGRAIDIRTRSQVAAWTALSEGRQPTPEAQSVDLIRASR
jgi:small-conductance mechanosensitive channel/CRP-like cAMP-binding protein